VFSGDATALNDATDVAIVAIPGVGTARYDCDDTAGSVEIFLKFQFAAGGTRLITGTAGQGGSAPQVLSASGTANTTVTVFSSTGSPTANRAVFGEYTITSGTTVTKLSLGALTKPTGGAFCRAWGVATSVAT
jgi:hypothetical protein